MRYLRDTARGKHLARCLDALVHEAWWFEAHNLASDPVTILVLSRRFCEKEEANSTNSTAVPESSGSNSYGP